MATNSIPVPDTFEGKPTTYELFDGFRRAPTLVKGIYLLGLAGFFFVGPLVLPIVVEGSSYISTNTNRKRAEKYYAEHPAENTALYPVNDRKPLNYAMMPELNPGAPQDGRLTAALGAQQPQMGQGR